MRRFAKQRYWGFVPWLDSQLLLRGGGSAAAVLEFGEGLEVKSTTCDSTALTN